MKKGWTLVPLKEVCLDFIVPQRDKPTAFDGDIPWCRIEDIEGRYLNGSRSGQKVTKELADKMNMHLCPKGTVISACSASIGNQAITTTDCYTNQTFIGLVVNPDLLYNVYLYFFLESQTKSLLSLGQGATIKYISKDKYKSMLIPLPSIGEQQRIVSRLDSAFAHIDELKANAEKQLCEARALFQRALTKVMEPKEGWEEKMLGDVCEIFGRIGFRGYTTKDLVPSAEEGAISLSPSNIQDGKMDYSKCTYISWFKYEESPEIKIFDGDILLVKTGSSYGKSALVENLPHAATINPQSVVLKNMKINTRFFAYQLRTYRVRDEFDKFVSGTAIPTFSQAKLSTVTIYFPSEEEQQRIVSRLDSLSAHVRELEEVTQKTIAECDALKQALLRKVFE